MKSRLLAIVGLAVVSLAAGCRSSSYWTAPSVEENPTSIVQPNYELVWDTTIEVLEEYFDVSYENRYDGTIETAPVVAATILEPWRLDTIGLDQRFEATIHTIRRRGFVLIQPAPAGGFQIVVEVYKEIEDLPRPIGARLGAGSFIQSIQPIQEQVVSDGVTPGAGWISLGRDTRLESQIISEIHARLAQCDPSYY